jgi:hypothetical protein
MMTSLAMYKRIRENQNRVAYHFKTGYDMGLLEAAREIASDYNRLVFRTETMNERSAASQLSKLRKDCNMGAKEYDAVRLA